LVLVCFWIVTLGVVFPEMIKGAGALYEEYFLIAGFAT
jgi:hypothetical protein